MLSFNEFVASKVFVKNKDVDFDENFTGYVYADFCYISYDESNASYYLIIHNHQYVDELDKLEVILYEQFYVHEA
jgi:hypothetical protein